VTFIGNVAARDMLVGPWSSPVGDETLTVCLLPVRQDGFRTKATQPTAPATVPRDGEHRTLACGNCSEIARSRPGEMRHAVTTISVVIRLTQITPSARCNAGAFGGQ
jgi:hypothetical protein